MKQFIHNIMLSSTINSASSNQLLIEFRIFEIDTVITVKEDDSFYFRHNGHGMAPINYSEDIIKYEKEKWYKNVTGFQLREMKAYYKTYKMLGDKVGHITLDKKAAFTIEDEFDLKIVNHI